MMNQGHLARLRRLRGNSHERDLFFFVFQLTQFTCVRTTSCGCGQNVSPQSAEGNALAREPVLNSLKTCLCVRCVPHHSRRTACFSRFRESYVRMRSCFFCTGSSMLECVDHESPHVEVYVRNISKIRRWRGMEGEARGQGRHEGG